MKFHTQIHTDTHHLPNVAFPVYFTREYLNAQKHPHFIGFESSKFFIPITLNDNFAISIPKSPFGSFLIKEQYEYDEMLIFFESVKSDLKKRNVEQLVITHPSEIYQGFEDAWFEKAGFQVVHHEINQHILLSELWEEKIHKMQKRKLHSLIHEGFEFRVIPLEELEVIHQFIAACRQTQGLEINISLELLKVLAQQTESFDLFGVYREGKISAACISVRVSNELAYYYLPATSPLFRSQSPMVLLLKGMVSHYHQKGYKFLDLGVSSVAGNPQQTLRIFKERMGAIETRKTTWKVLL